MNHELDDITILKNLRIKFYIYYSKIESEEQKINALNEYSYSLKQWIFNRVDLEHVFNTVTKLTS